MKRFYLSLIVCLFTVGMVSGQDSTHRTSQRIYLKPGWNGISSYLTPGLISVENLVNPITGQLEIIKNLNGYYYPATGVNTLGLWDTHSGYFVKVADSTMLPVSGNILTNARLPLNHGWNLAPVLSRTDARVFDLFKPTQAQPRFIKEATGTRIYWPEKGIYSLNTLNAGAAYMIKMEDTATVNFNDLPPAQGIQLIGTYQDKNNDSLAGANVELRNGNNQLIASTTTRTNGSFRLLITESGLEPMLPGQFFVSPPPESPFRGAVKAAVTLPDEGIVLIVNEKGHTVAREKIKEPGTYLVSWGGRNRIGMRVDAGSYAMMVECGVEIETRPVYYSGQGEKSPLEATEMDKGTRAKMQQHTITFSRDNTTTLELLIDLPAADTLMGIIRGNIGPMALGGISDTLFTIRQQKQWELDSLFHNDDQNSYTVTQSDGFSIVDNNKLQYQVSLPGNFITQVLATDPNDPELTATAGVQLSVLYTAEFPDIDIAEDSEETVLIENLDQYINPLYSGNINYEIVSQGNPVLAVLAIEGNSLVIDYLQPDGHGNSEIVIEISDGEGSEQLSFTFTVAPRADLYGQVTDIIEEVPVGGATVMLQVEDVWYEVQTNASGEYHFQFPEAFAEVSYIRAWISCPGFVTFHSWATMPEGTADVEKDFTITNEDFPWLLYNRAFRTTTDLNGGFPFYKRITTHHFVSPPNMHLINNNSLSGGRNITTIYEYLLTNVQTILPTFNPREVDPELIIEHTDFEITLQDNELGAYFTMELENLTGGTVNASGTVTRIYEDAKMNKCITRFMPEAGFSNANSAIFNQELGSCFGAVLEPSQSSQYESVFTDPVGSQSYTPDDYNCSKLLLNRSRVHYRNLSFDVSNPEAWDWEMRPDEVLNWYPGTSTRKGKWMSVTVYGDKGNVISHKEYDLNNVPADVMADHPMLFTPEQVRRRRIEEAQRRHKNKGKTPLEKAFSK